MKKLLHEAFIEDHYLCKSENVKWDSVISSHIIIDLGEQDDDEYDMDPEWNPSLEEYAACSDDEDYLYAVEDEPTEEEGAEPFPSQLPAANDPSNILALGSKRMRKM